MLIIYISIFGVVILFALIVLITTSSKKEEILPKGHKDQFGNTFYNYDPHE